MSFTIMLNRIEGGGGKLMVVGLCMRKDYCLLDGNI